MGTDEEPVMDMRYNYGGFRYEYSADGKEKVLQYLDVDGKLIFRNDYGCAQVRFSYDAADNLIEETYLDTAGKPVVRQKTGYAVVQNKYEKGQLTEIRYLDGDGNLVMGKENGYAVLKKEYNKFQQLYREKYFDVNEEPVISQVYHCAGLSYQYDQRGNETYVWYIWKLYYLI